MRNRAVRTVAPPYGRKAVAGSFPTGLGSMPRHPVPLGFVFRSRSNEEKARHRQGDGGPLQAAPRPRRPPRAAPLPSGVRRRPSAAAPRPCRPTARRPPSASARRAGPTWPSSARRSPTATSAICRPATRARCASSPATSSTPGSRVAEFFLPLAVVILVLIDGPGRQPPEHLAAAVARRDRADRRSTRSVLAFRLKKQLAARFPDEPKQGRRRLRPDAHAPDAPAAAAEAAGQARRAALSADAVRVRRRPPAPG